MKSATTAMKTHLAGDVTTLCRLYKMTRKDGTTFTFTDHDTDIDTTNYQDVFTDGSESPLVGYNYEAAVGFLPTATENKSDLSVDNQEATAFIDSDTIKEEDLRFGVWDATQVEIRVCNWADLSMGEIKVRYGWLGNITMKSGLVTFELLGLTNRLQILQGRTFGPRCDAELGDSRCGITVSVESGSVGTPVDAHNFRPTAGLTGAAGYFTELTSGTFTVPNASGVTNTGQSGVGTIAAGPTILAIQDANTDGTNTTYTWTLTSGPPPQVGQSVVITLMTSPGNNGTFTIASITPATSTAVWHAGYYDDGIMTFTSGVNSGLSYQIRIWDGVTLTTDNALFVAPSPGDTFHISPGCDHTSNDCFTKFGNLVNFRGFEKIPGQDAILQYPNATG
jgi:uncharacterized phage protein (TIGR02218 family)